MLLLSYSMKVNQYVTSGIALFFFLLFAGTRLQAQTLTSTINSTGGGTDPSKGMSISVYDDGSYKVMRLGKTETYWPSSAGNDPRGIVSSLRLKQGVMPVFYTSMGQVCEVTPTVGDGSAARPYRVSIYSKTKDMENYDLYITTTISYVVPNKYFTVDYTLTSDNYGYSPHLYLSEYVVMQQNPAYTYTAPTNTAGVNSYCGYGFKAADNSILGGSREAGDCPGAAGPFAHAFAAFDTFKSYFYGAVNQRNYIPNGGDDMTLQNIVSMSGGSASSERGMAVEVKMDIDDNGKVRDQSIGTRVLVGYGEDINFNDIVAARAQMITQPVSTGSSAVTVEFEGDVAADPEGNAGNNHKTPGLRLKVSGGILKIPTFIKMKVTAPAPGEKNVAVPGVDYNFESGFMIPAGDYTTATFVPVDNITVIGNNRLEYNRHMTLQLENSCNQLVKLGAKIASVYTITDDEDRTLTFTFPATSANEGTILKGKVSLPSGVLATEDIPVNVVTVTGGTAIENTDYKIIVPIIIANGSNYAEVPVDLVADKVLENPEKFTLKATADVMGQPKTATSPEVTITDDTRNHVENTLVSITVDGNSTAPFNLTEGFNGILNASLPAGVTTDIPINVTILRSGTATEGTDYDALPAKLVISGSTAVAVPLVLKDDKRIEGTETLILTPAASDGTATVFSAPAVTVNIEDIPLPAATPIILKLSVTDIDEGGAGSTLSAALPAGWTTELDIKIDVAAAAASTAAAGSYKGLPPSLTIAKDQLVSQNAVISADPNQVLDDDREIVIHGSTAVANVPIGGDVTLKIHDKTDPALKTITLKAVKSPLNEGDITSFTLSLPAGVSAAKDITVALSKKPTGTEAADTDFSLLVSSLKLPANTTGEYTVTDVVRATADKILEKDEALFISGTAAGYTVNDTKIVINDLTRKDPLNTVVSMLLPVNNLDEGNNTVATFSLPAGVSTEIPLYVSLALTGTATRNDDYTMPSSLTFTPPTTTTTAQLDIAADKLVEMQEMLTIKPTVTDDYTTTYTVNPSTFDFTINDKQYPIPAASPVTLSASPANVAEGSSTMITAALPFDWVAAVPLTISLVRDDAASTADVSRYQPLPASIVIPVGKSSATTNFTANSNDITDDDATVKLDGNPGNINVPATSAVINITDNTINQPGARNITLTPDITAIPEGQKMRVTVSMPYASAKKVTIQLSVDPASEADAAKNDYQLLTTTLELLPGQKTATFDVVNAQTDNVLEKNESLLLHATANGYTTNDLTLSITDVTRTIPANLKLDVALSKASPLTEGDQSVATFSLPAGITTEVPIVIQLPQTAGTAEAGPDYTLSGTVILNAGNSTTTTLVINKDNFVEGDEDFTITPSATDLISTFSIQPFNVVIKDDPAQYPLPSNITLTSTLDAIDEGGAGAVLGAQLPNGLQAGRDIVVHVSKDGVASTAIDTDHSALTSPFDIVIKKGQQSGAATFELKALADFILEDDETIVFTATTGDPNMKVDGKTITIRDRTHDDPATGRIFVTSVTPGTHVKEGDSYTLKISLAPKVTAAKAINIGLATGALSVASASDLSNLPAQVTLPANTPDINVTFTANTDFILEKDELLWVVATPQNWSGMKGDSLSVTIDDATRLDPSNLKMEMRIDSSSIFEGHTTAVTFGFVNNNISSSEDLIININRSVVSTADNADYSGLPAQVTLPALQHSKQYQLQITDDNVLEGNEQLQLNAQLVTPGYLITQPGQLIIPETGDMNVKLLKGRDASEPATSGIYTIKLAGNSTAAADVKVVFYVSSIAGTTNIAPIQTSAVIPAGKNSVDVPVNIVDNKVIEGDEEVRTALMLAQMKRFGNNIAFDVNDLDTVRMNIHDDESDATGPKATEREMMAEKIADASEPATPGTFRIRFTNAQLTAVKDVTVNYIVGGTAVADSRYKKLNGTIVIPAGKNSTDIQVDPIDNKIVEGDENVQLQLQSVSASIAGVTWPLSSVASKADVLIHDNDTLIVDLYSAVTTANEGDAVKLTLKSASTAAHDIPVRIKIDQDAARTFTVAGGTASGNIITVNYPALQPEYTFTVTVTDNDINDDDGFLKAVILPYSGSNSTPLYKAGAVAEANVSITDNDPLTLTFAADKFKVKEGNTGEITPLIFDIKMNRKSSRAITVNYDFEESTDGVSFPYMDFKATPGVDFENTTRQTVIPALQDGGKIAVNIIGDTAFEQNETFIVRMKTVSVPSGQHTPVISAPDAATGVILNDDAMCRKCDTDGDGLTDEQEDINGNGDPFDDDTDNDGIPNFLDLDSDNDGVPDSVSRWNVDKNRNLNYLDGIDGKIRVHPAISPNNDGIGNDAMYIENIEKYPKNEVVIFNRWGGTVFKLSNYDNKSNNFRGKSNTGGNAGADVPDGSYFYNIRVWVGGKEQNVTGYIVIKR
ncbi:MAG TPA: Calx-beta domain-containing protein [Chitinophaga sp.]|uniref:Calx-beta domain-containing protein n=1 Tax=Chitinophaga sp. TaxID=1869181 RepID=UPI002C8BC6DB|nr:Calx-beta domain-containing protein [Chitinophaga sp.]HVI46713.1 Calx-beta domain-containing protein [Chitinophaga sp.]